MRSIKFPNMFSANSTNCWKDGEYLDATKQNTKLTLRCERGELFGDPYFGLLLEHFTFEQNSYIMRDALADMIYEQLALFIPQVKIKREDIRVIKDRQRGKVIVYISGINQIDYKLNTFSLTLFENNEAME